MLSLRSTSRLISFQAETELHQLLSINSKAKPETIFPAIIGLKKSDENRYLHAQIKNWNNYITRVAIMGHTDKAKYAALCQVAQQIFQNNALTYLDSMVRLRTTSVKVVSELETLIKNIHQIVQSRPIEMSFPFEGKRSRISSLLHIATSTLPKAALVRSKSSSCLTPQLQLEARVMVSDEKEKRLRIKQKAEDLRFFETADQKENFFTYYLSLRASERELFISYLNEEKLIVLFDEICKNLDNNSNIFEFLLSMKLKSLVSFISANNLDPYRTGKIHDAIFCQRNNVKKLKNWFNLIEEELNCRINAFYLQVEALNTSISQLDNAFFLTQKMIDSIFSLQSEIVLLANFIDETRSIFKSISLFDEPLKKLSSLKIVLENHESSPVSSSSSADLTLKSPWAEINTLKRSHVFLQLETYTGDDSFEFLAEYGIYTFADYIDCGLIEKNAEPSSSVVHFKKAKQKLHESGIVTPEDFLKYNIHNAYFLKCHLAKFPC